MGFMDSLKEVGKQVSQSSMVIKNEEDAAMLRKYFPEVQQALASGLGAEGFTVVINPDPNAPAHVDLRRKIIQVPTIADGNWERVKLARGFIDHELGHVRYTERSTVKPPSGDHLFPAVAQMLEDLRVDSKTVSEFPGSQLNLSETFMIARDSMREAHKDMKPELKDLYELFEQVYATGALDIPKEISDTNVFKDLVDLYANRKYSSTSDTRKEAKNMCGDIRKIVENLNLPEPPPQNGGGEPDPNGEPDPDSKPGDGESKGKGGKQDSKENGEKGDGDSEGEGEGEGKGGGKGSGEGDEEDKEDSKGGGEDGDPEDKDEQEGKGGGGKPDDKEKDGDGEGKGDGAEQRGPHESEITDQGEKGHSGGSKECKPDPISMAEFERLLKDVKMDVSDFVKNEFKGEDYVAPTTYTRYIDKDLEIVLPAKTEQPQVTELLKDCSRTQGHLMSQMIRMYKQERPLPKTRQNRGAIDTQRLPRIFTGDTDIFIRKQRQEAFNIAFTLISDLSGSMSGTKLYMAMTAAIVFGKVLDALKIPTEVLGFSTEGFYSPDIKRDGEEVRRTIPLRHYVFKNFQERMNWVVNGRIETMISGGGRTCHNVDGEAVEWAGRRLLGRKEQKKVMIVMSDGQPEDSKGSTMLHNHLIYTVKELKKKGVILIGVGIQTTAVRSFYDDYVVLNNVNELPRTLLSKVESKLMQ